MSVDESDVVRVKVAPAWLAHYVHRGTRQPVDLRDEFDKYVNALCINRLSHKFSFYRSSVASLRGALHLRGGSSLFAETPHIVVKRKHRKKKQTVGNKKGKKTQRSKSHKNKPCCSNKAAKLSKEKGKSKAKKRKIQGRRIF